MKKIIPFYASLLVFYAIVMLVFILAGSHGRLIFSNGETLRYLGMVGIFIITAIVSLISRGDEINKLVTILKIILNIITLVLLFYQMSLLYPEIFTFFSIFILSLHSLGLVLGGLIIINDLSSQKSEAKKRSSKMVL